MVPPIHPKLDHFSDNIYGFGGSFIFSENPTYLESLNSVHKKWRWFQLPKSGSHG